MFKCRECEREFEESRLIKEDLGECHGSPSYVDSEVCPYCGSSYFYDMDYEEEEEDALY